MGEPQTVARLYVETDKARDEWYAAQDRIEAQGLDAALVTAEARDDGVLIVVSGPDAEKVLEGGVERGWDEAMDLALRHFSGGEVNRHARR